MMLIEAICNHICPVLMYCNSYSKSLLIWISSYWKQWLNQPIYSKYQENKQVYSINALFFTWWIHKFYAYFAQERQNFVTHDTGDNVTAAQDYPVLINLKHTNPKWTISRYPLPSLLYWKWWQFRLRYLISLVQECYFYSFALQVCSTSLSVHSQEWHEWTGLLPYTAVLMRALNH